ncbi:MAG TPA: DUF5666 domain-containing protein [Marmoricola sp.]|nr:DUF5666 domain-containing protein [Marmoricola sp.]
MNLSTDARLARKVTVACGAVVLLLGASACGSGSNDNTTGTTGNGDPQTQQQSGPDNKMPGANGKVAAVADSTAQVQGMDGQVAVTWNGTTSFTKEVTASLADVKVGDCVFVGSAGQSSAGSTPAAEVTAASVRITRKTNGSCTAGMRGPGGSSGDGPQVNGTPPQGVPSGGTRPQLRGFGGAVGEVTAVSASGFTVSSVRPGSDSTTPVSVTVDGSTSYTSTAKGSAADVKVGACITATGSTDDTGAVTARSIAVSQPRDGQCGGLVRFQSSDGSGTKGS